MLSRRIILNKTSNILKNSINRIVFLSHKIKRLLVPKRRKCPTCGHTCRVDIIVSNTKSASKLKRSQHLKRMAS